jgi:hypothetical protein
MQILLWEGVDPALLEPPVNMLPSWRSRRSGSTVALPANRLIRGTSLRAAVLGLAEPTACYVVPIAGRDRRSSGRRKSVSVASRKASQTPSSSNDGSPS